MVPQNEELVRGKQHFNVKRATSIQSKQKSPSLHLLIARQWPNLKEKNVFISPVQVGPSTAALNYTTAKVFLLYWIAL